MKTENPLHMWDYWVEKYGFEYALEHYYPECLGDPRIHQALMNCKINEQFIMNEMRLLASLEEEFE